MGHPIGLLTDITFSSEGMHSDEIGTRDFCINHDQNRNLLHHLASFRNLALLMPLKMYNVMVELFFSNKRCSILQTLHQGSYLIDQYNESYCDSLKLFLHYSAYNVVPPETRNFS